MPINLKTPVVESGEQRLGTVVAWDGRASDLMEESGYSRGCRAGCGGKARLVCERSGDRFRKARSVPR